MHMFKLIYISSLTAACSLAQTQDIFPSGIFRATDAQSNDGFGSEIAVSNELMLVGALYDSDSAFAAGSVYVIDLITGKERHKLVANDPAALDRFGNGIAFSGNLAIIGAPQHDSAANNAGAAYLFDLNTGNQLAKLFPDTPRAQANFGSSVAMLGNTITIGAKRDSTNGTNSGLVFIFNALDQTQTTSLSPSDSAVEQMFGSTVAITQQYIAVSAVGDQSNGPNAGAVYLFDHNGTQITKLTPEDPQPGQEFGFSLDMSNTTLVVGAPGDNTNGQRAGAAYTFDLSTLQQQHKLFPEYAFEYMNFGQDIAINQTTIAVGSSYSGPGIQNTNAYAFDAITGEQIVRLRNTSPTGTSEFGDAVGINDHRVFVGDSNDDQSGSNAGAVFEYGHICEADLTGDFMLNFFDVSAFLNAFTNQDPLADFNADAMFNYFDVSAYLHAFATGCP